MSTSRATFWYEEVRISSWAQLSALIASLGNAIGREWLFRGHASADWRLSPSLERVAVHRFNKPRAVVPEIEKVLLRDFKRYYHLYSGSPPQLDDDVEWLSLMQHHGAPTRLLDWTYSAYVALFFAIEAMREGDEAAVWLIDHRFLWDRARAKLPAPVRDLLAKDTLLGKEPATFRAIFDSGAKMVVPLNSFRLNQRLSVQQGIFLAPLDLTASFEENLLAIDKRTTLRENVMKLTIATGRDLSVLEMLRHLHSMNINRRSLFPGLDGFAQSYGLRIGTHRGTFYAIGKGKPL